MANRKDAHNKGPDSRGIQSIAGLVLRPEGEPDLDFLLRLYSSTRQEELAQVDWSDTEKAAFLRSQFEAQRSHYLKHYSESRFDIIEQTGTAIGRLYVARWPDDIRIVDIAFMPEHTGHGLGGGLLRALQAEAAETDKSVSIHVEIYNPALRLYERLGFKAKGEDNGVYRLMEWRPGPKMR